MSAQEFREQIFRLFYQDVHRIEQNNYDYRRFSYDGVDRSQLFDVSRHALYLSWFCDHYADLFRAYSRLSDQPSRDLYVSLIRYKLSGHLHMRIPSNVPAHAGEADAFQRAFATSASSISLDGILGKLLHHEGAWQGVNYAIDTVPGGMAYALVYGQYYYRRDGVSICPERGDYVVDAGAFTGDSSVIFSRSVGPQGHVYAFDPVERHLEVCRLNFSQPGCENITLFPYGVSNTSVDAPTIQMTEYLPGYRASSSDTPVPLRKIDDVVADGKIERIDFLKMDVEGSEMAALRGAESSIRRFKPKLAISIYHKPSDFYEIIDYVHELGLGYSLFLEHHTIYDEETVLYATIL